MHRRLQLIATLVALLTLVAVACGSDDPSEPAAEEEVPTEEAPAEEEVPTEEPAAPTAAELPTDEEVPTAEPAGDATGSAVGVQVSGVTFDTDAALIINTGDNPVDLTGHWICNRPNYAELPPIELAPGEGFEFTLEGFDEAGGEVAIYVSSDFANSEDMISYVQWGTGGGRSSVAEAAGLWTGPPAEASPEGVSLVGEPGSAAGWG